MRPITISLDSGTWELAKKKTNFSQWVRDQLRSERNKMTIPTKYCTWCDTSQRTISDNCVNKECKEYMSMAILQVIDGE